MQPIDPAAPVSRMSPRPASVRYNDWRQVAVEPPAAFKPVMPVSVIVPAYKTPAETLARTLAALEGQTYPRHLFEVVIVDDGSQPPLTLPRSTPLDVKVVRQEHRGFGASRARNTGARAAAHDILLFLDSDVLVEAGWMAAHARWRHAVSDALTLGSCARVAMDGIDAETIRRRPGSLQELFSDRPTDPPYWIEGHMLRTNDLTSRANDLFGVMLSGNFGIDKSFYRLLGGMDESFTRWGMEDIEFGYRAYTRGGLLVPVRDAAWHQGRWDEGRAAKDRSLRIQHGKAAHLIAHPGFRSNPPGRIYAVPQYVVTIAAGQLPAEQVIETAAKILADRVHDLTVRIEMPANEGDERLSWLRDVFGPDPRVRVAPTGDALDEFPAAAFHVTLPASAAFAPNLVYRLRAKLRGAVTASALLSDGTRVSITRAWALHRARRAGGGPADFGDARTLSPASLKLKAGAAAWTSGTDPAGRPTKWERLRDRARDLHGWREGWWFVKWLCRWGLGRLRRGRRVRDPLP